ncbi:MAG: hypothetical protein ACE1Z6_03790, partial [Candidatus Methylomirabilales bacterium]
GRTLTVNEARPQESRSGGGGRGFGGGGGAGGGGGGGGGGKRDRWERTASLGCSSGERMERIPNR